MSKVLFLCDIELRNPMRGTPIHVARLLTELRSEHDLVVCAASVPPALEDIFVPYPRVGGIGKLRALLKIVDEHKPQTIFTIGQVGLVAPVLLKLLRRVRIVTELQGVEYVEKYAMGHIGLFGYYLWKCKSMCLLPFFDVVIAFTRRTASLYPFLRKIAIIFPGIDIETIPTASPIAIPPLVIGYSGNTDAYQGVTHIIEAAAQLRTKGVDVSLRLVLSGTDSRVAPVRELVEAQGLVDVTTILRNLSHKQSIEEMQRTSVLPIPRTAAWESVYGFPSKLPECLALGLPVITSNVGAVPELMPQLGDHAIIIPADNITEHLVSALMRVVHMSVDERATRGAAAREYAKCFSWQRATRVASEAL
jgi:glycosyltransferase involved in cell wall biosynthesis